jgi:hypothetical protein
LSGHPAMLIEIDRSFGHVRPLKWRARPRSNKSSGEPAIKLTIL